MGLISLRGRGERCGQQDEACRGAGPSAVIQERGHGGSGWWAPCARRGAQAGWLTAWIPGVRKGVAEDCAGRTTGQSGH